MTYNRGNYVRAVTLMETAQSLGGKGADYAYHLGMAYFKINQPDKAREQLELALADDAVDFVGKDEARQTLEALKARVRQGADAAVGPGVLRARPARWDDAGCVAAAGGGAG